MLLKGFSSKKKTIFWLLFVLTFICLMDRILLGPYAVYGYFDMLDNDFPHLINQGKHLLNSGIFSWYPNLAGGMPAFAGQHPPYFPPSILGSFLPLWLISLSWSFLVGLAACYGIYRFLHEFIEISSKIALLCAFMGTISVIYGNIQFTMTYCFPLFFMWTHDLCSKKVSLGSKIIRLFGLITISATSYPVLTLPHFPIFHFFLYIVFGRSKQNFFRNLAAVFMVWTGYVLFFVPTIYSLFNYIPFAQRDWNFPTANLTEMLLDYLDDFVGKFRDTNFLPISLLGLPLIFKDKQIRRTLFFILIPLLISTFFGAKTKALIAGTFFVKMDLFMFATVALIPQAMFAALVMDALRKNIKIIPKYWIPIAILLFIPIGSEQVMIRNITSLGAALTAVLLLNESDQFSLKRPALMLTIFCACMASMLMFTRQECVHGDAHVRYAQGFDNHSELTRLAEENSREPFRVACADVHPAIAQSYGLDTIGSRGPLFNKFYKGYFKKVVAPQLTDPQLENWFDSTWRYLTFTREKGGEFHYKLTLDGPKRSVEDWNIPLLLNLGVKYILSARPIEGIEKYAVLDFVDKGKGLPSGFPVSSVNTYYKLPIYGYKLNNTTGMVKLASKAKILQNKEEVLKTLSKSDTYTIKNTVFLSKKDTYTKQVHMSSPLAKSGKIKIDTYKAGNITMSGKSNGDDYIVIPVNYDSRWKATVNGEKVEVLRADYAFLAIPLKNVGTFKAVLRFETPTIWWLHIASAAGILLMILIIRLTPSTPHIRLDTHIAEPALNIKNKTLAALKGSTIASAIWLAGYYFFVYLKHPDSSDPQIYMMITSPVIGISCALWAQRIITIRINED